MENSVFEKTFANRTALCFFLIMMLILSSVFRVAIISTENYSAVQAQQASFRIEVAKLRGTIYDCNMVPLTNNLSKTVAAVSPTPKAVVGISSVLEGDDLSAVLNTLSGNKPAVCTVGEPFECDGISCTKVYERDTADSTACHILGYTDSTGHGVSGLELAFDDLLYSDKAVSAVYTVDGRGGILNGVEPYFENDLSVVNSGVVTTIDINIQNIVEDAVSGIESGAAVVASASSGKIRAIVSRPLFQIDSISKSLESSDAPLINRALTAFSVGSVFKPCVAAAALEMGRGNFTFDCTGSTQIIDRQFKCHKLDGHGNVDLCGALAQSCNCYFYNFANLIGAEKIYKMASSLGFGSTVRIAGNMSTVKGNLPQISQLTNEAQIANLSIGQGDLLLSPVSMLPLYCAIANDGSYYLPSIVEKTLKDGKMQDYDVSYPTKVMSQDTAQSIRTYLQSVITDGTGGDAAPENCTAAGKTATAQTGRYDEQGQEITNSWFCGFFPAESPEYVVVVMSEGSSNVSTQSVFADIADKITELGGANTLDSISE